MSIETKDWMIAQNVREGQIQGWQGAADRWILDLGMEEAIRVVNFVMTWYMSGDYSSKFDPPISGMSKWLW